MRKTTISGAITSDNIEEAVHCMPTAESYTIFASSNNFISAQAQATIAAAASQKIITVTEKDSLSDNKWEIECSAGTFYYTIPT